jgi:hypothetical protein
VYKAEPLAERFWSRVQFGAPGECWKWLGAPRTTGKGYGRLKLGGKTIPAHRVAFMLAKPSMYNTSLLVLHTCDNQSCVRPGHLYQGTQKDNIRDMFDRGRARRPRGEKHPGVKLMVRQVKAIRRDKRLHKDIAADYGVSDSTVSRIKRRQGWKHI